MTQVMRSLWEFSRDCRFDRDQQSRMAAAMLDWLPGDQRLQAWNEVLGRCQREGMTELRAVGLAELFAGVMRNVEAAGRRQLWDAVLAACNALSTTPMVAAHLCRLLARQLAVLEHPYRAIAAQALLSRI
jgi:hypothetical protein